MCMQIYVVVGQDAVLPGVELCKRMASANCKTSLIISSAISFLVPTTFRQNTLTDVFEIPCPESGSDPVPIEAMKQYLESYLITRRANETGPIGAIVDVTLLRSMDWLVGTFYQNHIPVTGFFTNSAYSASAEYMASSEDVEKSGGLCKYFPGCVLVGCGPKVIGLTGEHPPWIDFAKRFMGVMINTCDVLERPYMDDLYKKLKLRVWGVGPLVPQEYFRLVGTAVRPINEREASVIHWLDSMPRGSVLFVSFGASGDLTTEENERLFEALEASTHPFIWLVPPESHSGGYYPTVSDRVRERGLVTSETVPLSKILNHPCVAGFLSHCNWEPTMEAIGLGVPLLAWPKTGEQFYNAELVVKKLKVGYYVQMVNGTVTAKGIGKGIDKLMRNGHMKRRTADLGVRFSLRFPQSSSDALDRFTDDVALL